MKDFKDRLNLAAAVVAIAALFVGLITSWGAWHYFAVWALALLVVGYLLLRLDRLLPLGRVAPLRGIAEIVQARLEELVIYQGVGIVITNLWLYMVYVVLERLAKQGSLPQPFPIGTLQFTCWFDRTDVIFPLWGVPFLVILVGLTLAAEVGVLAKRSPRIGLWTCSAVLGLGSLFVLLASFCTIPVSVTMFYAYAGLFGIVFAVLVCRELLEPTPAGRGWIWIVLAEVLLLGVAAAIVLILPWFLPMAKRTEVLSPLLWDFVQWQRGLAAFLTLYAVVGMFVWVIGPSLRKIKL